MADSALKTDDRLLAEQSTHCISFTGHPKLSRGGGKDHKQDVCITFSAFSTLSSGFSCVEILP